MENVTGEHFEMTIDLYFNPTPKDAAPDFIVQISPIQKIEAN